MSRHDTLKSPIETRVKFLQDTKRQFASPIAFVPTLGSSKLETVKLPHATITITIATIIVVAAVVIAGTPPSVSRAGTEGTNVALRPQAT